MRKYGMHKCSCKSFAKNVPIPRSHSQIQRPETLHQIQEYPFFKNQNWEVFITKPTFYKIEKPIKLQILYIFTELYCISAEWKRVFPPGTNTYNILPGGNIIILEFSMQNHEIIHFVITISKLSVLRSKPDVKRGNLIHQNSCHLPSASLFTF